MPASPPRGRNIGFRKTPVAEQGGCRRLMAPPNAEPDLIVKKTDKLRARPENRVFRVSSAKNDSVTRQVQSKE